MTYLEIVKRLEQKIEVRFSEVTGLQVLMLLRDKKIANFSYENNLYEINFIPTEDEHNYIQITNKNCSSFREVTRIINHCVVCYKANIPAYIMLEDEKFEVYVDILENRE